MFQISGLPVNVASRFFGASPATLEAAGIRRVTADAQPGYPCRVSLRDAEPGESVLLMNYFHLDEPTPYKSCHAIYVIEGAKAFTPAPDEVPDMLGSRLFSV